MRSMKINGAALKRIRELSGHTQLSLAAATNGVVNQGRISELENGKKNQRGVPLEVRPTTAMALAAALQTPVVAFTVPESDTAA